MHAIRGSNIPYTAKHWRIWQLSIDSPKFSHPNIVNALKCNVKPTQFAKVLHYTSRAIKGALYHSCMASHQILNYLSLAI